jgi:chromosome segregation ATPase
MIEFIEVKNFQSHTDTRIDFSEDITAITGLSMSGKTAIKRAFEWVRKNRPTGFKFNYRYGEDPTKVNIGVDGHVISMEKTKKAAEYKIAYPDGSNMIYTAFGTSVPEDITNLLGVSDISVQDQLDAYLLVISSAGEIARTINRITGIDIGDRWIKDINRSINITKKKLSVFEGEVGFLSNEVLKYDGAEELSEVVDAAYELQKDTIEKKIEREKIVELIDKYNGASLWVLENKSKVDPLQELLDDYDALKLRVKDLNEMKDKVNEAMIIGESIGELQSALSLLEPALAKFEDHISRVEVRDVLLSELRAYENIAMSHTKTLVELERKKKELVEYLVSIGSCYICGGELTDRKKIMESIG